MHSCMFCTHFQCVAWMVCIFFLRFSERLFLGLVGEVDDPLVYLLPRLAWSASSHYFFVLKVIYQHLGYLLVLSSQPCLIWKIAWKICSVIEVPFLFWFFRHFHKRFQIGQGIFPIAPAWAGFSFSSNISGYLCSYLLVFDCLTNFLASLLSGGSCFSLSLLWWKGLRNAWRDCFDLSWDYSKCLLFPLSHYGEGLDVILIIQKFPNFLWDYPNFSEWLLQNCEQCPGKSAPFPLFSSSCDGECVYVMFPFSLPVFFV